MDGLDYHYYWQEQILFYLCQQTVNKDRFGLAESVRAEYRLQVVGGVPAGIKNDNPVGSDEIDSQRSCLGGDEEQPYPGAKRKATFTPH